MKKTLLQLIVITFIVLVYTRPVNGQGRPKNKKPFSETSAKQISVWLTRPDKSALFKHIPEPLIFGNQTLDTPALIVDDNITYQSMDGFGYCLTGGSAMLLARMSPVKRRDLLKELFGTNEGEIGVSYLRVSIGASDLDDHVFSYDDMPPGQKDPQLTRFSIAEDKKFLIPVLKEILAIAPSIKILGSPWSPPAWMKTNDSTRGGSLLKEFYPAYAKYFAKYIQAMKQEGIAIDAITVQNEPLHPGNNPSLLMLAPDQADFVKNNLGPTFKEEGIKTKIIVYDHNADKPEYPISILDDPEARKFVDGSAFHLYGGKIEALSKVHEAHPDKNLYFTEQWVGAPGNFARELAFHIKELIIGAPNNWAKTVLEWNLAADPEQNPHTPGGCTRCLGAVTIDGDNVVRNPAYYIIAHASRFVRPGSIRISSSVQPGLANVAYLTPGGKKVLIVQNNGPEPRRFSIVYKNRYSVATLGAGDVGTYVW